MKNEKMSIFIKRIISVIILNFVFSNFFPVNVLAEDSNFVSKTKPKKDKYIIVSDSSFAPFEYQDNDGKYVGIDVDIMNRVADLCNFKLEMQFVGFDAALNKLTASQADGMISGMSITDERKKTFLFSDPYFDSNLKIAVKKEKISEIKEFKDLKNKRVGAKIGSASQKFLEEKKSEYDFVIQGSEEASTMYQSLENKLIDALVDDEPVLRYAIKQGQNFELVGEKEEAKPYGFAVKKGENEELVQMFNETLVYLKKTKEYEKILDRYLKSEKVETTGFLGLSNGDWLELLKGLSNNLVLISVSFVLATIIGVFFGMFSVSDSKVLRTISAIYVDIARGIPLIIVAFFVMFALPKILRIGGFKNPMHAGIIALTLNASAYISEIFRGGINAISKGQTEASRSLGLSYKKTMQKIILPQAFKIMIPSLVNQFVISLKDTTILTAISVTEVMFVSRNIVQRTLKPDTVYAVNAIIFLMVITALTKLAKALEKRVKAR